MKNIYIVLTQTGTLFSKLIRWYTHDPYNHASISFHSDLDVMYSFGRKTPTNAFDGGFVKENLHKGVFAYFPETHCCVLEIPVSDQEYNTMYSEVMRFCENEQEYRYNLVGILGHLLGQELSFKNHFYCSQFVSYIMNKTSFWDKPPALTKPMDFYDAPNKKVIFEGMAQQRTGYSPHLAPQLPYRYNRRRAPLWNNQRAAMFFVHSPSYPNSQLY